MKLKPLVFSVIALGASAAIAQAAPAAAATDQVAASFDRLLNHAPTLTVAAVPATLTADADPLRASVSVVLWDSPSYHLPVKSAQLSMQSKSKK
jgi:hypothetical protein